MEDEGPESERISFMAAGKNRIFIEAVTTGLSVASADAAVETVIFAVI